MTAMTLAGSVALILFATRFLRKGLDRLLSSRHGLLMGCFGASRLRGFLAGAGLAALAPSSTGIAAIAARLARDHRVSPAVAVALTLGANLGLTALVVIGAAGIEDGYPLLLVAGVLLFQFTARDTSRGIGQLAIGLGLVFLGMHLTKQAIGTIDSRTMATMLDMVTATPLLLALIAAVLTVALQSSSVAILVLMCVVQRHAVGGEVVLAWVAGANLGLIATALAIAWPDPRSRVPALAAGLVKGAVIALALLVALFPLLPEMTRAGDAALVHVLIAVATVIIGMPLSAWLPRRLARNRVGQDDGAARPRYLGLDVGGDRGLAMANAQREILHVSERARAMLEQVRSAWRHGDGALARNAAKLDDHIDALHRDITAYLAAIETCGPAEAREQRRHLRYLTEIETIGDIIERDLARLAARAVPHARDLPEACRSTLETTCAVTLRAMLVAELVFANRDPLLADTLVAARLAVAATVRAEQDDSLARRRAGIPASVDVIYLDLLAALERITRCACSVADELGSVDGEPVSAVA